MKRMSDVTEVEGWKYLDEEDDPVAGHEDGLAVRDIGFAVTDIGADQIESGNRKPQAVLCAARAVIPCRDRQCGAG